MRILLVRHGESTGNRDHIWAGITDNELTNHGYLQAQRLGTYLSKLYTPFQVKNIYGSDLIRAKRTATAVADSLGQIPMITPLLREQDLGWREGRLFQGGNKAAPENLRAMQNNPGESKFEMDIRAKKFIEQLVQQESKHFPQPEQPILETRPEVEPVLIIVSHGLFLLRLYNEFVATFKILTPPAVSWSNTGYTEIRIKNHGVATVTNVNSLQHLQGLKRTRAGVGSSQYDIKQRKVSDFFTKKQARDTVAPELDRVVVSPRRMQPYVADHMPDDRSREASSPPCKSEDEFDLEAAIEAIDAACAS